VCSSDLATSAITRTATPVHGEVTSDGEFTMVAGSYNEGVFSGQFADDGFASGTWQNVYWGDSGTFAGQPASSPQIQALSAAKGRAGDAMTITGKNLWFSRGEVLFGTTPAVVYSWNNHNISVAVPEIDMGSKARKVRLKIVSATGKVSNARTFKVLPPL
jgi:hypothetical protein